VQGGISSRSARVDGSQGCDCRVSATRRTKMPLPRATTRGAGASGSSASWTPYNKKPAEAIRAHAAAGYVVVVRMSRAGTRRRARPSLHNEGQDDSHSEWITRQPWQAASEAWLRLGALLPLRRPGVASIATYYVGGAARPGLDSQARLRSSRRRQALLPSFVSLAALGLREHPLAVCPAIAGDASSPPPSTK